VGDGEPEQLEFVPMKENAAGVLQIGAPQRVVEF
jgi:hypothetical protein